jgi:hypothetical protein
MPKSASWRKIIMNSLVNAIVNYIRGQVHKLKCMNSLGKILDHAMENRYELTPKECISSMSSWSRENSLVSDN